MLVLAALVIRLVFLTQLWDGSPTFSAPEGGDSDFYDRVARHGPPPGRAYFHSPLYQWFVTAVYAVVGRSFVAVRVIQHLIGAATVVLVAGTTLRIFKSWPMALVGAGLYAVSGPPMFYEGQLLVDALVPALSLLIVFLALGAHERPTARNALLLGLVVGLAALGRGTFLLWLMALAWLMWRRPNRQPRQVAALVLGASLAIVPVTVRNYVVERDFVLTAANAGLNLYIGNNPRAYGGYMLPRGLWFAPGDPKADFRGATAAAHELGYEPSSSELSHWWSSQAIDYATSNPGATVENAVSKLRYTFNDYEMPQLYHYDGYRTVAPVLRFLPSAGWMLFAGLLGLGFAWRRFRDEQPLRILGYLLVVQVAAFLPFFVVGRFRVPLLALLAPMAGFAVVTCVARIRERSPRAIGWGAGTAALCGLIVFSPAPLELRPAFQYYAFGRQASRDGDLDAASDWYRRSLGSKASFDRALIPLSRLLLERGELAEAEARLTDGIEGGSKSGTVRALLAEIRMANGDVEGAERTLKEAIRAEPRNIPAWTQYGALLEQSGRMEEAASAYESAASLHSDPAESARLKERAGQLRF